MTRDELEFSIALYADGTLPAPERAALEQSIERDASARALLAEYRALGDVLADARTAPVPKVRWDRLALEISSAVVEAGRSDPKQSSPALREPSGSAAGPDVLEFALAQCADGTLCESERPAVEARLADDPAAIAVVMEYEAVDALLRRAPLPDVRWDALAEHLSAAVARHAARAEALPEGIEFAVAQYAEGTLAADQRAAVEAKLDAEPAARLALAEYAGLDAALKSAPPLPDVRWDRLAAHLSAAVAAEGAVPQADDGKAEQDTRSFRLFAWAKRPVWLAAAASVLLAVGIGIRLMRPVPVPASPGGETRTVDPPPELIAVGPTPEAAAGEAVAEINIGPSLALQQMPGGAMQYADDVVSRPSRTIIASGMPVERDGPFHPF